MEARKVAQSPEALDEVIDRAVTLETQAILDAVDGYSLDDIAKQNETQHWDVNLIRLYKASAHNPDIQDTVSQLLELVKYQIKNNHVPDEAGRVGYAKYSAFLKTNNLELPPANTTWYWSRNAEWRMGQTAAVGATTYSIVGTSVTRWATGSGTLWSKVRDLKERMGMYYSH